MVLLQSATSTKCLKKDPAKCLGKNAVYMYPISVNTTLSLTGGNRPCKVQTLIQCTPIGFCNESWQAWVSSRVHVFAVWVCALKLGANASVFGRDAVLSLSVFVYRKNNQHECFFFCGAVRRHLDVPRRWSCPPSMSAPLWPLLYTCCW